MNTTSYSLHIDGADIPIVIRRHPSSRRMTIRYQPLQKFISLTLPRYVGVRQGLDFISSKRNWIANQLNSHPERTPFSDGSQLPILGQTYTLRHVGGRGTIKLEGDELLVYGDIEFMERRVRTWIKEFAKAEISKLAHEKASLIGTNIARISLRDNSSCWGSCTRGGNLSFSWRLIFAAPEILDYVVCHEVAHRIEHNHSKRFWAVVESICPSWEKHYNWLHANGKTLYSYG